MRLLSEDIQHPDGLNTQEGQEDAIKHAILRRKGYAVDEQRTYELLLRVWPKLLELPKVNRVQVLTLISRAATSNYASAVSDLRGFLKAWVPAETKDILALLRPRLVV